MKLRVAAIILAAAGLCLVCLWRAEVQAAAEPASQPAVKPAEGTAEKAPDSPASPRSGSFIRRILGLGGGPRQPQSAEPPAPRPPGVEAKTTQPAAPVSRPAAAAEPPVPAATKIDIRPLLSYPEPLPETTSQPTFIKPPAPDVVPTTWEFKAEIDSLRSIQVRFPDRPRPELFWYLRYTVTNESTEDHTFVPEFILYTDTGQVVRAGTKVPTSVFQEISKRHNDPLQRSPTAMTGRLLVGEDNAKTGVAIWPDFDPAAGVIDIFIGGLSGETRTIALPKPIEVTEVDLKGERKTVTKDRLLLSKTLHVRFEVPGEASSRPHARPRLIKKEWVLR